MENVEKVIALIRQNFPNSSFDPVKSEWITEVEGKYQNIPNNLKYLYSALGYGTVGDSFYSIHVLVDPSDIYDQETSKKLQGKLIVGDDFGGTCHAYDAENNWIFGCIDCNGAFSDLSERHVDFIDFLEQLSLNESENK
jgi:hypothetical protein